MNILVVGAGFSGAVVARELAEKGFTIDIIDSRDHIGGNAADYVNDKGISIHRYGPHIFHTNNKRAYDWVRKFGEWVDYKHKVKAQLKDGRYVTFPVNLETQEIVGTDNIIDTFFRPYTKKMWGKTLEELDPSIPKRVAVRQDLNEYYFPNDTYEMLPVNGYISIFENILDHKNITVKLKTSFDKHIEDSYDFIFNSMAIDEYHDFKLGRLPYRSLKFHHVDLPINRLLPTPVVNFTHEGSFTRLTEWKNFPHHGQNDQWTSLTYEEPCDYSENDYQRYYPINDFEGKNRKLYEQYKAIPTPKMQFIGRCGLYVYIDMHQAINSSLQISEKFINSHK